MVRDIRIVVLQRGWVLVGEYWRSGDNCELRKASVIRRWGTQKGLGEIITGPLKDTICDPCGTVRFHILGEIMSIEASDAGWNAVCPA
jgi:hypothetical protein